jgi:hypothetical protein
MKRALSLAPLLVLVLNVWAFASFCASPGIWSGLWLAATLYVVPPLLVRLLDMFRPLNEGVFSQDEPAALAWDIAMRLQAVYDALPFLETVLRLVPGVYSMWLRLWGSRVGYEVIWPIQMQLDDRSLLDIGNRVVVGRDVSFCAHKLIPGAGPAKRMVKRIEVRDRAMLEAGVRLEAGTHVAKGAVAAAGLVLAAGETLVAQEGA